ncbi:MAG TPA: hypothetical protein VMI54_29535 [Polyangiaceae bacterium]|nr:hypothetical protein [Polyangiaceae bacterium]
MAVLLGASVASADPGITVAPASSPPEVEPHERVALHDAVASDLANNQAAAALDGFTLLPKLVELRRFVEGHDKPTLVCVVELTVVNGSGVVVARTRASANSQTATKRETLDAAAQAATARLALSLDALSRAETRDKVVARR